MKNRIYWVFVTLIFFQFLILANYAFAQTSCSSQGGVCAPGSCSTGWHPISFQASSCPPSSSCCVRDTAPNTSCSSQGGVCAPGSCSTGWHSISFQASSCPPSSSCCVRDNSPTAPAGANAITFKSPLRFETVEGLLASVMGTFQGIVVTLALIFFIGGAIVYITSAGNDDRTKSAKNAMTAALIGMALAVAAPSILKTVSMVLGWNETSGALGTAPTAAQIGLKVLEFLLGIVGTLGLIMLIIGGIMYFGSSADEKNVEAGKKTVKYAIIGIALALASMVIVRQITALLTSG